MHPDVRLRARCEGGPLDPPSRVARFLKFSLSHPRRSSRNACRFSHSALRLMPSTGGAALVCLAFRAATKPMYRRSSSSSVGRRARLAVSVRSGDSETSRRGRRLSIVDRVGLPSIARSSTWRELAHVARPVVLRRQRLARIWKAPAPRAGLRVGELRDISRVSEQDIAGPIAQRRHADRQHAQAVIEVACGSGPRGLRSRRRRQPSDHARPDGPPRCDPEPLHLLLFDQPQQLRLRRRATARRRGRGRRCPRRPARSVRPRRRGIGERAALVPNSSASISAGERRAVDDDERLAPRAGTAAGSSRATSPCRSRSRR